MELNNKIISFVDTDQDSFIQNGKQRYYCDLNKLNNSLTLEIKAFADYCYNLYNIEVKPEIWFGNFIGVNLEGGAVHPHKDPRSKDNEIHVRINFLVSKPIKGGMPVLDHSEYQLNEGDCWVNLASEYLHESTTVEGDKPRIVLSLGSYVAEDQISNLVG